MGIRFTPLRIPVRRRGFQNNGFNHSVQNPVDHPVDISRLVYANENAIVCMCSVFPRAFRQDRSPRPLTHTIGCLTLQTVVMSTVFPTWKKGFESQPLIIVEKRCSSRMQFSASDTSADDHPRINSAGKCCILWFTVSGEHGYAGHQTLAEGSRCIQAI